MQTVYSNHSIFRGRTLYLLFALYHLILCSISSAGEPSIPDSLKPWREWVLHDRRQSLECIPHFNDADTFQCAWPTAIDLELNSRGGRFTQQWQIYHESYIQLPGSGSQWPVDVMVDGVPAMVVSKSNLNNSGFTVPTLKVLPGGHTVTGTFVWSKQPEYLQIPSESALVTLTMDGEAVEFPNRDDIGRLWLKSTHVEKKEENRLKVESFRLVDDSIPLQVILYATLDVAGEGREVKLGPLYSPDQFIPLAYELSLPSKLESDGTMRIQVKPGRYTLMLTMRHLGPFSELTFEPPEDGYWPEQEIWSLLRRPALRIVEISGGTPIDPKVTSLPEEWKSYPAYVMQPKNKMKFKEIKRGDPAPPPDQLNLHRTLWLAFDGTGYTVKDTITGKKNSGWRLEMEPSMQPGRVTVDGVEQLITSRSPEEDTKELRGAEAAEPALGRAGVELRRAILNLTAESRLEGSAYTIPATGWDTPFQKVTGELNLPPGWRLIAARGIDNIPGTWVKRWSLLDFFILLIFTISTAKLFCRPLALVSFITMVLLYHEPGAPRYIWLFLITGFALLKHLPPAIAHDRSSEKIPPPDSSDGMGDSYYESSGKLRKLVGIYQFFMGMILVMISVSYAVDSLRVGIYPQLERPWISMNDALQRDSGSSSQMEEQKAIGSNRVDLNQSAMDGIESGEVNPEAEIELQKSEMAAPAPAPMGTYGMQKQYRSMAKGKLIGMARDANAPIADLKYDKFSSQYQTRVIQYDPKSLTQTGPGLPLWQPFQTIRFSWSGPVEPGSMISFTLIGPSANLVLAFLRVALIIVLAFGMFWKAGYGGGKFNIRQTDLKKKDREEKPAHSAGLGAAIILLAMAILLTPLSAGVSRAGEIPSPQMLEELQRRLLEKDGCFPECADIAQMEISIDPQQLKLTLHLDAAVDTAIPVPGNSRHWLPEKVQLNSVNGEALFRSGTEIWVMVPAGKNTLVVQGRVGNQNNFQLPMALKPHYGTVNARGWEVQGIQPDGSLDGQLQFRRIAKEAEQQQEHLETGLLPPFALVERTLLLGLDWKVETTVQRLTPAGSVIVLNLPLLAGESVTTEGVRVKNGLAEVTLNSSQHSISFDSFLETSDSVRLHHAMSGKNSRNQEWTEVWSVDASPLFHIETQGIPVIMHQNNERWYPTWHPWPGEEVVLKISRPKGVDGQTLTIEKSTMELEPGQRSSRAILTLDIKSSQGGQHTIKIPTGAELQEVAINGETQLIRQEGQNVVLPVTPGSQSIKLIWREGRGITPLYRTPRVDLGAPSVNSAVDLHISYDRWTLFVGGEQLVGPAILFWSVIIVLLIVSVGLSMTSLTPLKFHDWFGLGIGISMSSPISALFVLLWLVVVDRRKKWGALVNISDKELNSAPDKVKSEAYDNMQEQKHRAVSSHGIVISSVSRLTRGRFNLMQSGIAALTVVALVALLSAISQGLIGHPSMNITGNGSTETLLRWYHDISDSTLPEAWLFSLPMITYRIAMLVWALWISFWLMKILKWGWNNFSTPMIWATAAPEGDASENGKKRRGIWNPFKSRSKGEHRENGAGGRPQQEADIAKTGDTVHQDHSFGQPL